MKICIIGCSNSSGSPIGYVTSKFKESEKKYGSVWGFDRNKGWVAELAKQQHFNFSPRLHLLVWDMALKV